MKPVLVVPCFNEESRFSMSGWAEVAKCMHLVCVDDGSRDGTRALLEAFAATHPDDVTVVALPTNAGKAEAVRQGLLLAIDMRADIVGFADADLATPGYELVRLASELRTSDAEVVMGSRRTASVERDAVRGLMGRIFTSVASFVIGSHFEDTQCGAKFFRVGEALGEALSAKFSSRWSFDVELLSRLLHGRNDVAGIARESIRELPLAEWTDVAGSKMTLQGAVRSGLELLTVPACVTAWQSEPRQQVVAAVEEIPPPPVSGVYLSRDLDSENEDVVAA